MDLKEAMLLGDPASHGYYRAKFAALLAMIGSRPPGRVLDVGAGAGFFARQLLLTTDCCAATCVDPGYERDSDEMVAGKTLQFRRHPGAEAADLVLLMDVLEHVPDDVALLAPYVAAARSGTRFVVTVPAFGWLWSEHDVFLEHYRRYTLSQVAGVCESAGLTVETRCYFYGNVLPLAALQRLLTRTRRNAAAPARSQMRAHSPLVNRLLWLACRSELPWFKANRLAGLTAFIAASKP